MGNRRRHKPLLLIDRDGTLIREEGYPSDPEKVRLLSGVPMALRKLHKAGFRVAVVSNQSGVGRGLVTFRQMHSVNRRFLHLLRHKKAPIGGLYWCPHAPTARCPCRKPALGMARQASRELHVPWKKSISVGDRASDVVLGQRTGGMGVLVLTGYGRKWKNSQQRPDHIAANFARAADWIIRTTERNSR